MNWRKVPEGNVYHFRDRKMFDKPKIDANMSIMCYFFHHFAIKWLISLVFVHIRNISFGLFIIILIFGIGFYIHISCCYHKKYLQKRYYDWDSGEKENEWNWKVMVLDLRGWDWGSVWFTKTLYRILYIWRQDNNNNKKQSAFSLRLLCLQWKRLWFSTSVSHSFIYSFVRSFILCIMIAFVQGTLSYIFSHNNISNNNNNRQLKYAWLIRLYGIMVYAQSWNRQYNRDKSFCAPLTSQFVDVMRDVVAENELDLVKTWAKWCVFCKTLKIICLQIMFSMLKSNLSKDFQTPSFGIQHVFPVVFKYFRCVGEWNSVWK